MALPSPRSSVNRLPSVIGLLAAAVVTACGTTPPATVEDPHPPVVTPPAATTPTTTPSTPRPPEPATKTGALLFATDAPIVGVAYESGAHRGTTDANGTFTYEEGAVVRFLAGDTLLGAPVGASILSPYQVAGAATCEDTSALKSLVALLEALDTDADATNGITIPAAPAKTPVLPAPDAALRTFVRAFDAETWTTLGTDTFAYAEAIVRGQGVASDGTSWFFSGTTGLERTNATFGSTTKSAIAIPLLLVAQGSDHIGDIDVYNGTIYAPVEDKSYNAPKVILYDATSLGVGTVYSIPQNLQTKGVPWIAVDGPRGVAYMAEWDPTPSINVFSLATMTFLRSLPLSTPTGRVQGGKVYKGQLYLSTDDAAKHVYKVHLASGTIFPLFALDVADIELEGLAFFARPDGSLLHTLDVTAARTGVELRHHKLTRAPLRWKVCP